MLKIIISDEQAADERLTAAAPDLLIVLRQCLKIVDAYRRISGGDGDIAAHNARHVIRQATGQSE